MEKSARDLWTTISMWIHHLCAVRDFSAAVCGGGPTFAVLIFLVSEFPAWFLFYFEESSVH